MKVTATLSRYLAKNYFFNLLGLLIGLLGIIYLFDTVELIRRASKTEDVPLSLVLQMGLLKLPEVGQILLPFAVLFSAIYTFWQLTRRSELVIVRAAGFSAWQFLAPVIAVAILLGLTQITIINPVGSLLLSKFEQLESNHLNRHEKQIALFKEGLWLRQDTSSGDGYFVLHASNINQPNWELNNVMVLQFDNEDSFVLRLNAKKAELQPGQWFFPNAYIQTKTKQANIERDYILKTDLTIAEIEESFASPETMSFWRLPSHIQTLEETGFDATRLRVHYQSLMAQPMMLAAMVLLAASVAMRPPRFRGAFMLITAGIFIGFIVFFLSSFLQALGSTGQIPVALASWSPALICLLLGASAIMNLEDG